MHSEVMGFLMDLKTKHPEQFQGCIVLEVGSYDINGTPRELFTGCNYTGIDAIAGKGVDQQSLCHHWGAVSDAYHTIICCEVLEHDPWWKLSLLNMWRMLKPGGLLILTFATPERKEHGTRENAPGDVPPGFIELSDNYYEGRQPEEVIQVIQGERFHAIFDRAGGDVYMSIRKLETVHD